ncbi:MAG: DUF5343 domain-containing protein [Dehalococcoidales bacterium]|nr:DUF5343 domain-containing protein [Dehalococcoidales bacterium]
MTIEVPYTSKPEDITSLLEVLLKEAVPEARVDAGYLESLGFAEDSSYHLVKILNMLGFIDDEGNALDTWRDYAGGNSGLVLAAAVKKAYADLFNTVLCPYLEDDEALMTYLKNYVQVSPEDIELTLQTFRNLTDQADFQDILCDEGKSASAPVGTEEAALPEVKVNPNLQLNIQIHIDPATSDEKIETIFKNMRKYLLGKGE